MKPALSGDNVGYYIGSQQCQPTLLVVILSADIVRPRHIGQQCLLASSAVKLTNFFSYV